MSVKSFVATVVPALLFVAAISTKVTAVPDTCAWVSGYKPEINGSYDTVICNVELAEHNKSN
jgi:hypothetical protein